MCWTDDEGAVKEETESERRNEEKEERHTKTEFISVLFSAPRIHIQLTFRARNVLQT